MYGLPFCGFDFCHECALRFASMLSCFLLILDAIQFNSLPGLSRMLPDGDLSQMTVNVVLGVPEKYLQAVDEEQVKKVFPYGTVSVNRVIGGLSCRSGVVLSAHGDAKNDDTAIVIVAAVEVYC